MFSVRAAPRTRGSQTPQMAEAPRAGKPRTVGGFAETGSIPANALLGARNRVRGVAYGKKKRITGNESEKQSSWTAPDQVPAATPQDLRKKKTTFPCWAVGRKLPASRCERGMSDPADRTPEGEGAASSRSLHSLASNKIRRFLRNEKKPRVSPGSQAALRTRKALVGLDVAAGHPDLARERVHSAD